MHVEYALHVLKERKTRLLEALEEDKVKDAPKLVTKIKHDLHSLNFAIELLETWED